MEWYDTPCCEFCYNFKSDIFCTELFNGGCLDSGYCELRGRYYSASSNKNCDDFVDKENPYGYSYWKNRYKREEEKRRQQEEEEERRRKEEEERRRKEEEEEEENRGGCYLTTITCEMLGFDDNCDVLETLRRLRKDFMQRDPKYRDLLFEYDTVGPKIAEAIREDADYELINGMYDFYILPVVDKVKEKKYDDAVDKYVKMTRALENYYGINFDGKVSENYDYTTGGHGKLIK